MGLLISLGVTATPLFVPPVTTDGFYATSRDDSDAHACQDVQGGGRVCLYEEARGLMPTFVAAYEKAQGAAGDLAAFPASVVAPGLTGPSPRLDYAISGQPTVDEVTASILDYTAAPINPSPETCPTPPVSPEIGEDDLAHVVQVFLRERAGLPAGRIFGEQSRVLREKLKRLDRATQNRWLDQASVAYGHCRPPQPLPVR
jgi:hypothetical protein